MIRALAGLAVALLALGGSATGAMPGASQPFRVAWAPSQQIVFSTADGQIFVVSPSGGPPRLLASGDGDVLSITPDGRLLYGKRANLFSIPVAGGAPRNLGVGFEGVWSPDGKQLAFQGSGGYMVESADGSHRRLVVTNRYGEVTGGPTWSPDGRKLAFVVCRAAYLSQGCEHQESFDVDVIGLDGSDKHRVTPKAGFPQCPAWSSIGKLAFYADDDLVAVVTNAGLRTFRPGYCPVWAPSGRRLAVATATGAHLMNFDGSDRKRITVNPHSAGASPGIAWSPDGKWLAVADGSAHPHLWVVRADGTGLKRLV
jgi:Tol biopolymer transport system component